MWQNAADDDLCQRPTGSRRPQRLEPCRTVTGRPRWPSWNPLDIEPEASAAPVALAWCGRTVERPTPNMQPHSRQTAAGSWNLQWCRRTVSCSSPEDTKWMPGPASLRPRLTWIWRAVGAAVAGSSHCDTPRPPVQTATADCRWRHRGHTPSLRLWYVCLIIWS